MCRQSTFKYFKHFINTKGTRHNILESDMRLLVFKYPSQKFVILFLNFIYHFINTQSTIDHINNWFFKSINIHKDH